ncbi:uncharacterized protein DS421_13g425460 [Arachis hypogaea]|nr:uncharacterized protein DS421_13g425460 [Arachis hypogaea]
MFKVVLRVERMTMEKPWLVTMFAALVMLQAFGIISGCFLEEKAALLEFKSTYFNASVLPSWVEDDPNCCGLWIGACHL